MMTPDGHLWEVSKKSRFVSKLSRFRMIFHITRIVFPDFLNASLKWQQACRGNGSAGGDNSSEDSTAIMGWFQLPNFPISKLYLSDHKGIILRSCEMFVKDCISLIYPMGAAVWLRPSVPVWCPSVAVPESVPVWCPSSVCSCPSQCPFVPVSVSLLCFWVPCSWRQKSSAAAAVETFHLVAFSSWLKWDPERADICFPTLTKFQI